MLKKGLFAVAASSLLANAAFAYPEVLTLDQLRHRCHELQANGQILPFTSHFTCSEERTSWRKVGEQKIPLLNESEIRIRAQIKDGAHDTDWWVIPVPVRPGEGSCDILEQWKTTARASLTFRSCAELDAIVNEAEFCKHSLQPIWNECDAEMAAIGSSSSSSSVAYQHPGGACESVPTGLVRGCVEGGEPLPPLPPPACPTTSVSSSDCHPDESVSSSCSSTSVSSESCDVTTTSSVCAGPGFVGGHHPVEPYTYQLGADVAPHITKKNFLKSKYEVVELKSDPVKDSLLYQAGFHKGDMISKINGRRVRNTKELQAQLAAAKKSGKARIKFRDARGKFAEKNLSKF